MKYINRYLEILAEDYRRFLTPKRAFYKALWAEPKKFYSAPFIAYAEALKKNIRDLER